MDKNIDKNKKINKYLNCIDIIYWINLDRSNERKNKMYKLLSDIDIPNQRISAIDGTKISDNDLYSNFIIDKKVISKIEYACLLSHLTAIETFSKSDKNIALILEDDVCLDYMQFWNLTICEIIDNAPKDWEIIMLNYTSFNVVPQLYTENFKGKYSSSAAYIINKNAALKLMSKMKYNNKFYLNNDCLHTSDSYIYSILKTYVYKYSYFTYHDNNDSTIHSSHLDYHAYSKLLIHNDWIKYYNDKHKKETFTNIYTNIYTNQKNNNKLIIILLLLLLFLLIKKIYMKS
jgi:GR25 family glycosyltransferase involved in LPS biosynthesis